MQSSAPYKLPALYVIDSIVRQSKHQFNESKEMYGPRFGKRLDKIFSMLYQCTEADKVSVCVCVYLFTFFFVLFKKFKVALNF